MFWKRRQVVQGQSVDDRRAHPRIAPPGIIRVGHEAPGESIGNAEIVNMSHGGVAIRCQQPVKIGERLVFSTIDGLPPVLCEVLESRPLDDGWHHVRCRCVLGGGFKLS